MARVKVLGLGSPHGDDRAGWCLVEMLPATTDAVALGSPSQLLDHLEGHDKVILVDACQSGRPPGAIMRFDWPAATLPTSGPSSHGLGVEEALALAECLGRLPPAVVFYAIEAGCCEPNQGLSPAVSAALPELCDRIQEEIVGQAFQPDVER